MLIRFSLFGQKNDEFPKKLDIRLARQMIFGTMDETATSWVINEQKYNLVALRAGCAQPYLERLWYEGGMLIMKFFTLEKEGQAAFIKINRPPANALSYAVISELSSILDELEQDDNVRAVLLSGEGRFFSAGADIKEFTTIKDGEEFTKLALHGQVAFERIENFPKPIVAAIHGAALGGGLELAMACHLRLVSDTANLGLPELHLGLIPGFAGTSACRVLSERQKRQKCSSQAIQLQEKRLFTGALQINLILRNSFLKKRKKWFLRSQRKVLYRLKPSSSCCNLEKQINFMKASNGKVRNLGKYSLLRMGKRGISAFLEKRNPTFKGL